MTLSEQLKQLRKGAGLTQQQLSNSTGVPQSRISQYERGAHTPSVETLEQLAQVLGPITIGKGEVTPGNGPFPDGG